MDVIAFVPVGMCDCDRVLQSRGGVPVTVVTATTYRCVMPVTVCGHVYAALLALVEGYLELYVPMVFM